MNNATTTTKCRCCGKATAVVTVVTGTHDRQEILARVCGGCAKHFPRPTGKAKAWWMK